MDADCGVGCHRRARHRHLLRLERTRFNIDPASSQVVCPLQCIALQLQCTNWRSRLVEDQITVRLPASLGRTLRRTSRRLGRRPSDIVRMALDAFLQDTPSQDSERARRVEDLIGSLSSGIPDLAERHREYILASLKHGR